MSHFSAVRTKIVNKQLLIESIREAGKPVQTEYAIRGFHGQAVRATVVAVLDGEYDLGFQWDGTQFNAVADFSYGSCGGGSRSLEAELKAIIQIYTAKAAMAEVAANAALNSSNVTVKVH